MRNLIWSGTMMVLLVGAGMFLGVQHAAHYPNSFVGSCARTIYHMWEPTVAPAHETTPDRVANVPLPALSKEIAQASDRKIKALPVELPNVIEPIVVEPTDQEPPLAIPRLSPEVAAAIERLRGEEESEAPPKTFDDSGKAPHMPYADEDLEILPAPKSGPAPGNFDCDCPRGYGFFFLPPSIWQTIFEKVMDTVNSYGETQPGSVEPADPQKPQPEIIDDKYSDNGAIQQNFTQNYHDHVCPYLAGYMNSYR